MPTLLKSIATSSGFLEECQVQFEPGLTCIIGARGTCKSTLVESIRFSFETNSRRIATLTAESEGDARMATYGIIKETLGAGSVRCEVVNADAAQETSFILEREVGSEPRIFLDGVREHTSRDVLRHIEIFSQGDLQRIAEDDNDTLRLELIDRPNRTRVAQLKERRGQISEQLRGLGQQLRTVRAKLSTLQHEVVQLDDLKGQLDHFRSSAPAASPELEAERLKFERRQQLLESLESLEIERAQIASHLSEVNPSVRRLAEGVAILRANAAGELGKEASALRELEVITKKFSDLTKALEIVPLSGLKEALHRRFEGENELYYRLRQQEREVNESLKQQQALKRQVEHLQRQRGDAENARAEEIKLLEKRKQMRAEIARIDDELYELRIAEIDSINHEHGETIQLTLGSSWNNRAYAERLGHLLSGSRIRAQDEVALSIGERIEPSDLIDIVEAGNAQRLADLLGRDLGQMTRVVAHLSDHSDLYGLETELPGARLEITFFDEGQPKPVETLSKGQRATALLPIILRPLPYPLVFDQPEDDLDNKFIFRSLITTLRSLKTQRQLIFVTHNANIPVLGDANSVIVMRMLGPTKAAPALIGTVESRKQEILDLLEGGAEAFAERELYYHELLTEREGRKPDIPGITEST